MWAEIAVAASWLAMVLYFVYTPGPSAASGKPKPKPEQDAKADAERKAKEEAAKKAAQAQEAQRKAKEEAERKAKAQAEAERKAKEEAERKAKAQAEAERKAKEEAERKAKAQAEAERKAKAQAETERKAKEEEAAAAAAKAQAKQEAAAKEEAAAAAKAKEEAERKAKEEAQKAKEEAERKAKAEAERKAKEEAAAAAATAKEEAERKAKAEAERKAKAEAEHKAKEEAERKAKEEAERKAKEEAAAAAKAKAEAERKAKEEAAAGAAAAAAPAPQFDPETLAKCCFALKARVDDNVQQHGVPPADKLASFADDFIVASLQSVTQGAPADVKAKVAAEVARFGFDLSTGERSTSGTAGTLTLLNLQDALTKLCAEFPRPHKTWGAVAGVVPASVAVSSGLQEDGHTVEVQDLKKIHPDVTPTAAELNDLSLACRRLWDLDIGRLMQGDDYVINLQQGKKPYHEGDRASDHLFSFVDPKVFERPTFKTFKLLMDNYSFSTGTSEVVTHVEEQETREFLDAISKTPAMNYVYSYLKAKSIVSSRKEFMSRVWTLWFKLYRRETRDDTCGFEHVFVGEEDEGEVKGMHNWLRLYLEEQAGKLDYRGYIFPRGRRFSYSDPFENDNLITIQFAWEGDLKPVSTSFVGVTPEFEVALYTLCAICGKEETRVQFGPHKVDIRCYLIGRGSSAMIGTAFPEDPSD